MALDTALAQLDAGDFEAALAVLTPFDARAALAETRITLSRIAMTQGRFDAALAQLERAEADHPQHPGVLRALAAMHELARRPIDALAAQRRRLALGVDARACLDFVRSFGLARRASPALPLGELRAAVAMFDTAPDAGTDEAAELELAELLFDIDDLANDAQRRYRAVRPTPPTHRDHTLGWVRLHDWCERTKAPLTRAAELGVPGHRPMLATLREVDLYPAFQWNPLLLDHRVALSGFTMHRMRRQRETPTSPVLLHSPERLVLRLPVDTVTIDEPALLVGGIAQYYHQTIEYLGTLAIAERLGADPTLKLLVNADLADFQRQQFAMLGIADERLLPLAPDRLYRFRQLAVASRPVLQGQWIDPIVPAWWRRLAPAAQAGRRLYLARRGVGRRGIDNEAELDAMLAARGFQTVQPEQLSVREQIELFAEASHIVGPAGAALTNMVYAPPGAQVVVINSRYSVAGRGAQYFDALAQACGHHHASVDALPVRTGGSARLVDADLRVDLDELAALLP